MSMTAAQQSAYQSTGGLTAVATSNLVVGLVMAILLLWGAWAVMTAYKGWATNQLDKAAIANLISRFLMLYLVVGALILA